MIMTKRNGKKKTAASDNVIINNSSRTHTNNGSSNNINIFFDDEDTTSDDDDDQMVTMVIHDGYAAAGDKHDDENDDDDDDVKHGVGSWSIPLPPSRQRRGSLTKSSLTSASASAPAISQRRSTIAISSSQDGTTDAATPLLQKHRKTPQQQHRHVQQPPPPPPPRREDNNHSTTITISNSNNNNSSCMKHPPQKVQKYHFNDRILFGDTGGVLTGRSNNNRRRSSRHQNKSTSDSAVLENSADNKNNITEIELQGRRRKRRTKKRRRSRNSTFFCRPDKNNKDSIAGYFFGFMFEDDVHDNTNDDVDEDNHDDNGTEEGRSRQSRHQLIDADTTIRSHLEVDGSGIFSSTPSGVNDCDDDYDDDYYAKYYSDDDDDDDDDDHNTPWNVLNMALFVAYFLTSATTTLPVLVVPKIGQELLESQQEFDDYGSSVFENNNNAYTVAVADVDGDSGGNNGNGSVDVSAFISRCASSAVLGVAIGKLLNAPLPDVIGARRTSSICAALLSVPLVWLSLSSSAASVTLACFLIEFIQSIQWPCVIVLLSVHYLPNHRIQYQNGIYLTSIASKLGSIVAVPLFSSLLGQFHWRIVCLVGAWFAIISSSVMYLYVMDSPTEINQPQNALQPHLVQQLSATSPFNDPQRSVIIAGRVVKSIVTNNLLPSIRHVLTSWTFWIVALSHTGSSLVLSSQRILGGYFYDTSLGYLPSAQSAGSLVVFLPLGTIFGLAIAGNLFAHRNGKNRKRLVTQLYVISIVSCYALSILSIPRLRHAVDSPDLILFAQIVASLTMGFGIAVMSSVIPGLASAAFGNHRGFYTAYTDGVAYGISSMVWRVVARSVEFGNPEGGGWAYGWAAVALLVVLSAILLIECWSVLPAINGRSSGLSTTSTIRV